MDIAINCENLIVDYRLESIFYGIVIDKIPEAYRENVVEVVFKQIAEIISNAFIDFIAEAGSIVPIQNRQLASRSKPPGIRQVEIPRAEIGVPVFRKSGVRCQGSIFLKVQELLVFCKRPIIPCR